MLRNPACTYRDLAVSAKGCVLPTAITSPLVPRLLPTLAPIKEDAPNLLSGQKVSHSVRFPWRRLRKQLFIFYCSTESRDHVNFEFRFSISKLATVLSAYSNMETV